MRLIWMRLLLFSDTPNGLRKKRQIDKGFNMEYIPYESSDKSTFTKKMNVIEELTQLLRHSTRVFNVYCDNTKELSAKAKQDCFTINRLCRKLLSELTRIGIQHHQRLKRETDNDRNSTEEDSDGNNNRPKKFSRNRLLSPPNPTLERIDYACCLFFLFELITRLIFCPSKKTFFKSWLTWIDIISVVACLNDFLINQFYKTERYQASVVDAVFLVRVLRIIRVFR